MQTTTTINRGDFVQLANGRSGKVCSLSPNGSILVLMDDNSQAQWVDRSAIVDVISGR